MVKLYKFGCGLHTKEKGDGGIIFGLENKNLEV